MEGKKIITNEVRFYPLLVSGTGLEAQTDTESDQIWARLDQIPENNKKILLSASIIENLYQAEQQFGWDPYYSARLAYFVRELFFQTISQSEFYRAAEALFRPQYQDRYNEILTYINNVILTSQPDPEEEEEEQEAEEEAWAAGKVRQHTLLDAMSRYPGLSNQFLTEENIKLKSQAALVRPTLSNWLKNYRDEIGIGKHDSVARATFLFESLNTKKLSSQERERLHAIIRSLEDNELLDIDTEHQTIVFASERKTSAQTKAIIPEPVTPSLDTFERFRNLSAPESVELKNVGTQTFMNSKATPEKQSVLTTVSPAKTKSSFVARQEKNDTKEVPLETVQIHSSGDQSPLGAIRFSAKHVLPAEKYQGEKLPESSVDRRPQYFRPESTPASAPVVPVRTTTTPPVARPPFQPSIPVPPQPTPVAAAPKVEKKLEIKKVSAGSIFRIKPSKE